MQVMLAQARRAALGREQAIPKTAGRETGKIKAMGAWVKPLFTWLVWMDTGHVRLAKERLWKSSTTARSTQSHSIKHFSYTS